MTQAPIMFGAMGAPHEDDHAVVGRSIVTVCGLKVKDSWLRVRGMFTAEAFCGTRYTCSACRTRIALGHVAAPVLPTSDPELSFDPARMTRADAGLPPLLDVDTAWVVRSQEHGAWWGANRGGYNVSLLGAGIYSEQDAKAIEETSRRPSYADRRPDIAMRFIDAWRDEVGGPIRAEPRAGTVAAMLTALIRAPL